MSVSVSQIGIDRFSLDRSNDQSRLPGQSLDQFICVCRCLYKEQHPPARSHFRRKILRPADLFSLIITSYLSPSSTSRVSSISSVHYEVSESLVLRDHAERGGSPSILRKVTSSLFEAAYAKRRTDSRWPSNSPGEMTMPGTREVATEVPRTHGGTARRGSGREAEDDADDRRPS